MWFRIQYAILRLCKVLLVKGSEMFSDIMTYREAVVGAVVWWTMT